MPVLRLQNGQPEDVTFNLEGERLVATFDWTLGQRYVLETDTPEMIDATSVLIRLPDARRATPGQEKGGWGDNSLFLKNSDTGEWSPAPYVPKNLDTDDGQKRIFELQAGWGTCPLRLSFSPVTGDCWFEAKQATL